MSKKIFYWIFSILIVLSLLLSILSFYLNPQVPDGELTLWTLTTIFVFRPVFNFSLGAVCAVMLFPRISRKTPRLLCLIAGLVLALLMAAIAGMELAGHPAASPFLQMLRQLFRAPGYFLIPGVLLGLGLFED